jgi:hypothetical protein
MVMVALDQVLAAVEALEDRYRGSILAERHIAQVVDDSVSRYDDIPSADQLCIHFVYVSEWPLAVLDDGAMPEVSVCGKEQVLGFCGSRAAEAIGLGPVTIRSYLKRDRSADQIADPMSPL